MKKSTLFFLSTLIAVFLSASVSYAYYSTQSECEANCPGTSCSIYSARCGYPTVYICWYQGQSKYAPGIMISPTFITKTGCERSLLYTRLDGYSVVKNCYWDGSYYRYQTTKNTTHSKCTLTECPANCSSCDSSSVCTTCNSGYYLSSGSCVSCPANATCNGSSTFTCNSGYTKSGSSCVQDKPKNTVSSCPSRMKLSSDGCCCINK